MAVARRLLSAPRFSDTISVDWRVESETKDKMKKKNSQTVNKKRTKEVERKKIKKTKPDRRARVDDPNRRNELSLTDRRAEVLMCRQRIRSSFFVFGVFFRSLFYYYYFFLFFFFLFGSAWLPNKLPAIQRFTINRTMATVGLRTPYAANNTWADSLLCTGCFSGNRIPDDKPEQRGTP